MRDVGKYIKVCNICQRIKNRTETLAGKLKLSKVPKKLWTHLIAKLLLVVGKDTICDKLSKMVYSVATTEEKLAKGLVWLFRDNIQKLYGLPETVMSDRELQFLAELMKELNRMLGIETKLSTSFYSQTNEQTEQMNQELEQYFKFFVDYRQKDWPEQLVLAEFTVNNKVHLATKISPFIVNHGRELKIGVDIRRRKK